MSKRVFLLQQMDEGIKQVEEKIKSLKNDAGSEEYFLYYRQLKALNEVNDYVSKYEWIGREDVVNKIKKIRESNYDYDLIKKSLNMTPNALKCLLFRTNKRWVEKIGANTIDLITSRYDKVSLGIMQFRMCSGKYDINEILLEGISKVLPKEKLDFYFLYDCIEEIKFLYTYSNFGMLEALEKLDKDKLAFLLYISKNPMERYSEGQKDLMSVLQGINFSLSEYIEKLQEEKQKKADSDITTFLNNLENGKTNESVFEDNEYNSEESLNISENLENDFYNEKVQNENENFVDDNDDVLEEL